MLITTKLHAPPLKIRMLLRKHLIDRLSAGIDLPLVVVSGPAGSGKTSLVCQWIMQENLRVAWYSLDEADNDSDLFFRYLLTALGRIDADLALEVDPWLQGQKRLSGGEIVPLLVQCLASVSRDLYLVLDDYHLITSREIHSALLRLLERIHAKMHVVIISRSALPFSLSRLRLRGQMVEIGSKDMKFSYNETGRLFRDIFRVKLSAGQIQEVMRQMEGWVGGFQLFGLATKGKHAVKSLSDVLDKACEKGSDYLIDEVINAQPERVQAFLRATAPLDRFNVDVCREVTGFSDASEVLDQVFRGNLFLNSLDNEGEWYRYHHLFSVAVRKRSLAYSPDAYRDICRTAALWFARNGHLEDAFRHAFASEDMEFAADLLEDYLMVLYERYEIPAFRRWLSKLPRPIFTKRALLRLYDCRFKVESVQLSEVTATLGDIESRKEEYLGRYAGTKRRRCDDLLVLYGRLLNCWTDVVSFSNEDIERVLERTSPNDADLCAYIRTSSRVNLIFGGNMRAAGEDLQALSMSIFSGSSPLAKILWFKMMATVERHRGHLRRSETTLKEAFLLLETNSAPAGYLKFMLYLPMAWVFYMRNDLARALEYVLTSLKYTEATRFVYEISDGNYLLALIRIARGEMDKVEQCVLRMRWAAREFGRPSLTAIADAYCAQLSIAQGDLRSAEQWAAECHFSVDQPFSFHFAAETLVRAEILYRQGRWNEVVHMLEALRFRCKDRGMMEAVLEMDILTVAALLGLGERLRARTIMEQALDFAEGEGYVRPFVGRATVIAPVLAEIVKARSKSSYVSTIAKACAISRDSVPSSHRPLKNNVPSLTRREREILELMAAGFKDKEIAERVFLSVVTVKTHAHHIFQKLDVGSRVQAIRRATNLKLLDIK